MGRPHDSGLRGRSYFDPGDTVRARLGLDGDVVVLLRPDGHVAHIVPWTATVSADVEALYLEIVGLGSSRRSEVLA